MSAQGSPKLSGEDLIRFQNLKKSEAQRGYLSKYSELNTLFATKPMEFFRRYAVLPPSDVRGQTITNKGAIWTDVEEASKRVVTGGTKTTTAQVLWENVTGNRVVRINFERMIAGNEIGAMTFKVGLTGVPIYFLPWNSLSVVSMSIPDVKGAFYDPDDSDQPGLFFTAAINGCSVFVKGSPNSPQIYHAGINGDFSQTTRAVDFWEARLVEILKKQGFLSGTVRQVNKEDYITDPHNTDPTTTVAATEYEKWLTSNQSEEFKVQIVNPWACVFGIRFGRAWSFYLQENATVTVLRYIKKSQTEVFRANAHRTQVQMKGTGDLVTVKDVPGKIGPFNTNKKIYMASQRYSRPLQIREFFPTGTGVIKIKDAIKRI